MDRQTTALEYFYVPGFDSLVNAGIEKGRKATMRIVVTDRAGNPPDEATIEYRQRTHEFKYGANLFMLDQFETEEKNAVYRKTFAECFNLATLPFYWDTLEPEKGKYRFERGCEKIYRRPAIDLCIDYCKEKNIEPKAHCLSYCYPGWLAGASVRKTKEELENRMRVLSERYAKEIPSWEVTNETLCHDHAWATKFFEENDYVEWCFKTADKYFPANRLVINEEWGAMKKPLHNRNPYYMQIERMLKNDAYTHLDSIGFQYHGFYGREEEKWHAAQMYNPEYMYRLFDILAKFGKPLQATEITLPAFSCDKRDEEVQAELLYNVYRLFFSYPSMEAIIYWNLVDGYSAFAPLGDMTGGENKFYGGLMKFDMTEKPALKVIRKLFNEEWRSAGKTFLKNGNAAFRGFYGDYDLTVYCNGKKFDKKISLSKNADNETVVELDF